MCGIAGIFNVNGEPVSPVLLRKMTDAIAHRGPDGEGFFIDSFVGLAHRRLAIIDLSPAGHQPMLSADGQYALVYNGEVYNFKELRKELEGLGYRFRSRSDTEVVLNAYIAWGEKALARFNGMFAFAVWDKNRQELFMARDRYGIKPLYYTFQGHHFIFGSEIKAILSHPSYRTEVDKPGMLEYFTFQNFFTDRTLFKGVQLFPAGTYARLPLSAHGFSEKVQYWDPVYAEPDPPLSETEYIEELDRLFNQAVRRQLVSDVDVGSFLSGGIDSGSVTAIAAKYLPYIKTFTCGFDLHSCSGLEYRDFDEREKAEYMSYLFKTEHYEMVLKSGDMERVMPHLTEHLEEPRVGQSYPNFYVSQLASKFVKVILTGTGGDEFFAGYPWRYYRAVVNTNFDDYIAKYYGFWQRLIANANLKNVFAPVWGDVSGVWTQNIFRDVFSKHAPSLTRPEDYVNHSLYFEIKTFLQGLLVVEDKLSMAHGLESRVPFLDNDLVDFSLRVPVRFKLGNLQEVVRLNENEPGNKAGKYFEKTNDGKLILRKVMERYVPREVTQREKRGFSAPDDNWFKGDSIEFVRRKLYFRNARIYEYMDRKAVQELVDLHLQGKENKRLLIWSLLYFEQFCETFL
ncbi:MAG: asparagine synthase (glutamine-hydrolyzing) [Fibrobacterota bacterium]